MIKIMIARNWTSSASTTSVARTPSSAPYVEKKITRATPSSPSSTTCRAWKSSISRTTSTIPSSSRHSRNHAPTSSSSSGNLSKRLPRSSANSSNRLSNDSKSYGARLLKMYALYYSAIQEKQVCLVLSKPHYSLWGWPWIPYSELFAIQASSAHRKLRSYWAAE